MYMVCIYKILQKQKNNRILTECEIQHCEHREDLWREAGFYCFVFCIQKQTKVLRLSPVGSVCMYVHGPV